MRLYLPAELIQQRLPLDPLRDQRLHSVRSRTYENRPTGAINISRA